LKSLKDLYLIYKGQYHHLNFHMIVHGINNSRRIVWFVICVLLLKFVIIIVIYVKKFMGRSKINLSYFILIIWLFIISWNIIFII